MQLIGGVFQFHISQIHRGLQNAPVAYGPTVAVLTVPTSVAGRLVNESVVARAWRFCLSLGGVLSFRYNKYSFLLIISCMLINFYLGIVLFSLHIVTRVFSRFVIVLGVLIAILACE